MDHRERLQHEARLLEALRARYPQSNVVAVEVDDDLNVNVLAVSVGTLIGKRGAEVDRWKAELVAPALGPDARVHITEASPDVLAARVVRELLEERYPDVEVVAVRLDRSKGPPPVLLVTTPTPAALTGADGSEVDRWKPAAVEALGFPFLVWVGTKR
jgi:ribosomal protein S3